MSLRFQADNDLKFAIVRGVRLREPSIDFASAFDARFNGVSDPEILERTAGENRVLISHDRDTMIDHFQDRLASGESSPGLLVVSQGAPVGVVIEAILTVWSASTADELRDQVHHLPNLGRHVFRRHSR